MADKKIITRKEARAQGLQRYFTGRPCKHDHTAERMTCNGGCVLCRDGWRAMHPERVQMSRDKWVQNNPEREIESKRRWRLASPEKQKAASNRWAALNRDRILARGRRYSRRHPERVKAKDQRRRAKVLGADGKHTAADLRTILAAQKYRCAYCRRSIQKKRHLDHIEPISKGGSNDRTNLQFLCGACNLRKGAKDPIKFVREIFGRLL
jgi:5-methylcytosine-specific restriction endonuclease McrA